MPGTMQPVSPMPIPVALRREVRTQKSRALGQLGSLGHGAPGGVALPRDAVATSKSFTVIETSTSRALFSGPTPARGKRDHGFPNPNSPEFARLGSKASRPRVQASR